MSERTAHFVPASAYSRLTRLYDPVVSLTTHERTFKGLLLRQPSPTAMTCSTPAPG